MAQVLKAWSEGVPIGVNWLRRVFSYDCALLREWALGDAPIFLDIRQAYLLWVFADSTDGAAYVIPYARDKFIAGHHGTAPEVAAEFEELRTNVPKLIADYKSLLRGRGVKWDPLLTPQRLPRRL